MRKNISGLTGIVHPERKIIAAKARMRKINFINFEFL